MPLNLRTYFRIPFTPTGGGGGRTGWWIAGSLGSPGHVKCDLLHQNESAAHAWRKNIKCSKLCFPSCQKAPTPASNDTRKDLNLFPEIRGRTYSIPLLPPPPQPWTCWTFHNHSDCMRVCTRQEHNETGPTR